MKGKNNIYVHLLVIPLIFILLATSSTQYFIATKVAFNISKNKTEHFNFSYSLPASTLPVSYKNENHIQVNSFNEHISLFFLKGITGSENKNTCKSLLFDNEIKIRYYYPLYIFNNVYRI